ncbi:cAMP-binding domain of CRP or a regulatory subunit of cAMP-dependent protein kinases [Zhouia amylolytica]|uniref:cAMP-binding domain of CRP or a regulatory subunit of cAMP-dependent protein kinases n=2 Tax=Zhouia amylolytica TaxID=376730 RepID=A0A1I6TV75_9FLAO|nr:cAMP-binding domain of CRP or a regulatory subunit of cAMP-dependent protein kinases [Zhouia amylolytica]
MMTIDHILDQIYVIPESSKQTLKKYFNEVSFPKGHILLRADTVENSAYFIKKGIVRAYAKTPDNDITFWFGKEGDPVLSMNSYVANKKGYEDIELLEACELYQIKTTDLQKLFDKDIHLANWGRRLAEQELVKTEERLISRQFRTAKERYLDLLIQNPDLVRRVQLGHIASYLGITQVTLSRIRAKKH